MTAATLDRTSELSAFLGALSLDDVPSRIVERAKDLVLDHLGVALHSADLPWSAIVRDYARATGDKPESTLYGQRERVGRRVAALANGTAAHGIELDDTHNESFSHPGTVVIPAALAVAEARQATGREFLAAVIGGYEAQCRAGAAASAAMSKGFHGTAVAGVFGAAAATAKLLKLSGAQLESAFGLAVSMASGVMQFTEDPEGGMVKRLHGGLPAHNGILAAELAAAGLRGPRQGIDGRYGFVRMFAHSDDASRLTRDLGESWEIDQISVKLYACCRMFHAFMDAIRECRSDSDLRAEEIESAEIVGPHLLLEGRMQYRPRSVMSAQYSLPYAVAATLLLDPQDPRSFSEQTMTRPDVLAVMDRVTGTADSELDRLLPEKYPGGVRFKLKDGRVVARTLFDSVGTPERPIDREGIACKFRTLTSEIIDTRLHENIIDAVFTLERDDGVSRLAELLRDCRTQ
jgi:2-methylcitrate dehydratase PrpD